MGGFTFTLNDKELLVKLREFVRNISARPLLNILGAVMRGSIETTFREQGVPAASWPPLAASTLKRQRRGRGGARQLLVQSGRLKNSITYRGGGEPQAKLIIGTNLAYAAIHQLGGEAGRRPPFKKKDGRRALIPARPFLVFRPEDPQRMQRALETFIQ
ncbi:MAG: phage virion morphogenesis protein, partial [Terriglobales bacterium]